MATSSSTPERIAAELNLLKNCARLGISVQVVCAAVSNGERQTVGSLSGSDLANAMAALWAMERGMVRLATDRAVPRFVQAA